jgi:hypothetical protein
LWAARPIVSLKYTIDDVEYLTQAEKDRMIASLASTSEEDVMAEYYCEYVDNQIVFKADGRIDRANVDRYDCV